MTLVGSRLRGKNGEPPCVFIFFSSMCTFTNMLLFLQPQPLFLFLECSQPALCIPEIFGKHISRRNMHHEFSNVIRVKCVKMKNKRITLLSTEGKVEKCCFFGLRRSGEEGEMQREPNSFKDQPYVPRKRDSVICSTPVLVQWHSD